MRSCVGCKYAKWETTKAGRLHPSGYGICQYEYKLPLLPKSRYWISGHAPAPLGGSINRHDELSDHCPYYGRKED